MKTKHNSLEVRLIAVGLAAFIVGCSDGSDPRPPAPEPEPEPLIVPFQELYDQGADRYLGEFTPMTSEVDGDTTVHTFGAMDGGPLCLRGGEYAMSTKENTGEELVIFLQGGGACWNDFCAATETADPTVPEFGLLDQSLENNPVADWDLAYLPYCDGSIFSGDADYDDDGDGEIDRYHRGVQNTSASLDVVANAFPSPSRILLTGVSAGGFGTDYALPLVRKLYPDVPIELINDSGVGVSAPGFSTDRAAEWNSEAFIAQSVPDFIDDRGHLTNGHIWYLNEDPNLRMGYMSTKQDVVIADVFLMIGGPAFEAELIPEMAKLEEAHPDRFRSLIGDGNQHTFVQTRFEDTVGGTTIVQWITDMLSGSSDWVSVSD